MFPLSDISEAYAVTAALVATSISPSSSTVAVNALALHVFFKLAVYWPSYILDVDLVRSYSHMCSVGALVVALWAVVTDKA